MTPAAAGSFGTPSPATYNMKKNTLNAMAGDFKFVECNGDRYRGETHELTGHGDRGEAIEFTRLIATPNDMVKIEQYMHTRIWGRPDSGAHPIKGLRITARLDRVYSSIPVGRSLA